MIFVFIFIIKMHRVQINIPVYNTNLQKYVFICLITFLFTIIYINIFNIKNK